jgi:ATP-binding cassette subfamily B protein/subfamily B ATP-binding cassette protein MsbA
MSRKQPQIPETEEVLAKGYDPQVVRRLVGFIRPYLSRFIWALVLMVIGSAASVAGPYLVKVALDEGLEKHNLLALRQAVLLYLILAGVQWLVTHLRVNVMARVGQSIIYDLRSGLFEHLQNLSLSFYNYYGVGRVISRVINDVSVLRQFLTWAILAVFRDLFTLVSILLAMLSMNLRLSLYTFTVLPLMVIATIIFRKKARENYRKVRSAISWMNSVLAENINSVRVVQAFSREELNFQHFSQEVNQHNLEMNLQAARVTAVFFPTIDLLSMLATALVIWLGGTAVLGEQITPGVLVAFVLYINRFFDPIRSLSQRYDQFQSTMASGERIFHLLDTPPEVQDPPNPIDLPPLRGEVLFDNVSFHYPDDPTPVLSNIQLHVQPGETVALVGETGAGKSTLVKLLSRFHDPTEGRVLIDGYDLRTVSQDSLRRQMGIVLQEPFLFSGTVRENIRFGRLDATDEEVVEAAKAIGAHEFITRLRRGYDTPVEEGGVLLSVGQRQLISFARALLADPRLLILDEATSSVDTQTEIIIQKALARLLHGRTAFVIAHRLSTIVNADRIIVIHNGKIVEQGTHQELLSLGGMYYRLYSMGFQDQ